MSDKLDAELRAKVIDAVCFRSDIEGHIEQFERIEALISTEVAKAKIELIKKFDNSVPNFWKTNQEEYTHQDMQNLLDLMAAELAEVESDD